MSIFSKYGLDKINDIESLNSKMPLQEGFDYEGDLGTNSPNSVSGKKSDNQSPVKIKKSKPLNEQFNYKLSDVKTGSKGVKRH